MKKLIGLIIAIITLIAMNTANPTEPAETPVIEPTSTAVETVKDESKTEEATAGSFLAVAEFIF